jgi:GT2 family glycosyltransferase
LEHGVRALLQEEAAFVAGHVQMVFQDGGPNAVEYFDVCLYLDQLSNVEKGGYGATANLFLRRELFERYGFFRQDLQSGGDVEFGRRLTQAGEKSVYASYAVVFHPARSTLRSLLAKEKRIGRGHRRLRDLGVRDGLELTWRSFVPWARVPRVDGIGLSGGQKAGVRALLICVKYLRLAYKLWPPSFPSGKRPAGGIKR